MAQRYAAQIIASRSTIADKDTQYEAVDIASVALVRPRRIGTEHLALHHVKQLKRIFTNRDETFLASMRPSRSTI
jgi:hypothetical protein